MELNKIQKIYHENSILLVKETHSKALRERGLSFHWWRAEPTSLHAHNFYEFFIVVRGAVLHEWNGTKTDLPQNSLHLLRPGDVHQITPLSGDDCTHMNITLSIARFRALCLGMGLKEADFCREQCYRTVLPTEDMTFLMKRAERINLLLHEGKRADTLIAELAVYALAALSPQTALSENSQPLWFTRILERLHTPDYLSCTAADVYALSNFSAPVIIDAFRKYTGKTVSEYLRDIKMHYACQALRNTDISTLELSNLLGYASLSHFSRIFREYTGLPPAEYRKQGSKDTPSG